MSREMTTAAAAALAAAEVRLAIFVEGEFPSGFVRLWSGHGDIVWDGKTWTGAGQLLAISTIEDTAEVVASGISVTLSGVPTGFVSLAITDAQQGLPGRIWVGQFDAAGALIPEPVAAFAGRLDEPTITDGAETCTLTITYESRLMDLSRPREWRYTHESQQVLFPGDRGFEYVTTLQDKSVNWG
jgi:hypothetical protein